MVRVHGPWPQLRTTSMTRNRDDNLCTADHHKISVPNFKSMVKYADHVVGRIAHKSGIGRDHHGAHGFVLFGLFYFTVSIIRR
jgi:hypothetical protein